jgi:hypothetical protein
VWRRESSTICSLVIASGFVVAMARDATQIGGD